MPSNFELIRVTPRTAVLYVLGFMYGITLAGILMWTAGFLLVYVASAQQHGPSDDSDKFTRSHLARLERAFHWRSQFDPTPQTLRIASRMMYVYTFAYCTIALTSPYSLDELSWGGWVFMEHTLAMCIALLVTSTIIVYWLRHIPKGRTVPQACYRCFSRINPAS